MKDGRSIQDLAAELARQADAKQDYLVDTRGLHMDTDTQVSIENHGKHPLTPHAHRQIGDRLGIPAKFYDKMRDEAPDLLADNVNHWFEQDPESRLVRTMDGRIRAFLSDRYRPLENIDLAKTVLPVLQDAEAEIASCEITERRFYLKAILPGNHVEIGPPGFEWGKGHDQIDVVEPGIVISNSEIGSGALAACPAIHTIRCSNLAVWSDASYRKFHIGEKLANAGDGDIWKYLTDETKSLTDAAIWNQVGDMVQQALVGEMFYDIVDELRKARNEPIEGDPVKAVEVVAKTNHMTDDEGSSILRHLIQGGDLTQYGMHNAVTRASADVESYDRASELESIGAKVIQLEDNQWQAIAQAT